MPAAAPQTETLAKKPHRFHFQAWTGDGEAGLRETLHAHRQTKLVQLKDKRDLLMNEKGRLPGGYCLTVLALQQICEKLSEGIYDLVADLSGMYGTKGKNNKNRIKRLREDAEEPLVPATDFSISLAIQIYNCLVVRRGDRLLRTSKPSLVVDEQAGTVEGVVGHRFLLMPSWSLYNRLQEVMKQKGGHFFEARMEDGILALRYAKRERIFTLPTPDGRSDAFHAGWQIVNGENGHSSLAVALCLFRARARTVSVQPKLSAAKLSHVRRQSRFQLDPELAGLFKAAEQSWPEYKTCEEGLLALQLRRLELGGSLAGHQARSSELERWLARTLACQFTAQKVMGLVYTRGSYGGPEQALVEPSLAALQTRTGYDLYTAICKWAARKHAGLRSKHNSLCQTAYKLALGQLEIP